MPRTGAFLVPGVRHDEPEEHHISEPRINDRIRVAEVRLVGPNGEQVGIVRVEDALRLAQDADLDLVEVAPTARPPVCKIMDFGKFKYEADMKAREARRNQANTVLKEIRFRLKIDPHDYGTKKGHVERFLAAGDKVKVMIMFRGREQSRPEMGVRLLQRLAADVAELGFIESMPKQDGRNMIMVLGPTKKKADQQKEQRRAAATHPRDDRPEQDEIDEIDDVTPDEAPEAAPALVPADAAAEPTAPAAPTEAPAAQAPAPVAETAPPAASERPAPERAEAPARTAPARTAPSAPARPAATTRPASSSGSRPASSTGSRPAPSTASRPAPSTASRPAPSPAARPAAAPRSAPASRPAA
ncbi:translation initiation factor IF-3, partial [Cellulomonas shaoxiangyii]